MSPDLERLERPLFSRGMVLTDTDLTALVDWTRGRLGLQRYRDGWGVACGLDVRCVPGRPGWIKVLPGYAVSPAGADLVMTAPIEKDLSTCAEPCCSGEPAEAGPCGDVVLDLYLDAAESCAVPELLRRCGCDDDHVSPTRVCEGVAVRTTVVPWSPDTPDPLVAAAKAWQEQYRRCHEVVRAYVEEEVSSTGPAGVLDWLCRQAGDAPCDWLPRLRARLTKSEKPAQVETAAVGALLELVVHRRQRLLRAACEECTNSGGVKLARIWLRRSDDPEGRSVCTVALIDAYPPYRRELMPSPPRPVAPGWIDLAPYVWQRWEQVRARWRVLTGDSEAAAAEPETAADLLRVLENTDGIAWDTSADPPMPVVIETPCLGWRVIGFHDESEGKSTAEAGPYPLPAPEAPSTPEYPTPTSAPEPTPEPVPEPTPAPEPEPQPKAEPELEDIRRIGPKTAAALRSVGIATPRAVVTASIERLRSLMPPATDPAEVQASAQDLLGRQS